MVTKQEILGGKFFKSDNTGKYFQYYNEVIIGRYIGDDSLTHDVFIVSKITDKFIYLETFIIGELVTIKRELSKLFEHKK